MRSAILAAALLTCTPAAAEPSSANAAAPAALDPARVALAKTTVDHIWPLGTYKKMMSGTFDQMMDAMMSSMFDMKVADVVKDMPGADMSKVDPAISQGSMRQMMMKQDPHFEERMRITNRVMMEGLTPLMTRIEPSVREGLARAYARRFTAQQLQDLNAFFATPSGTAYASESMLLFMDPEVMTLMGKMAPEMMKEMPAIAARMQAATAHLPPPKKPGQRQEAEEKVPVS